MALVNLRRPSLRDWPLVGAALAFLSLALLPWLARNESLRLRPEQEVLDGLRRQIEASQYVDAEEGLRVFLVRGAAGPRAPEANYLLGRSIVLRARSGKFPGKAELDRAWEALEAARARGFEPRNVFELQREIGRVLLERDLAREAVDRLQALHERKVDPQVALDLARALAKLAMKQPATTEDPGQKSADVVNAYLEAAPAERRLEGFLTLAEVYGRMGRHEQILPVLSRELEEFPRPPDKGRLLFEMGKALARLDRKEEALKALGEAETLLGVSPHREAAMLLRASVGSRGMRTRSEEVVTTCRDFFKRASPLSPVAFLVLGQHELETGGGDAIETVRLGLSSLRRPARLDDVGFDFARFYGSLRRAWEAERDPAALARFAKLLREAARLFPRDKEYALDLARIQRRAGDARAAAEQLLAAAASDLLDPSERSQAVWGAAEACAEGGLYVRAAELYRRCYDLDRESNARGLYEQGESLRRARIYGAGRLKEPDALAAYAEFVARAPAGEPLVPRAILHRAAILRELGRREDAVAELQRILRGGLSQSDPGKPEWAEALLARGRLLLEIGRAKEAREALGEYLERYSEVGTPLAESVEAGYLLARAAIAEKDWAGALGHLEELEAVAARTPSPDEEVLRHVHFLRGDLFCNQMRWEEAARAYDEAYRRHIRSEERLWGLLGRARALARLGRKEEARREYERGRAVYEADREQYERSLAGHGKDYWSSFLDELRKDLP